MLSYLFVLGAYYTIMVPLVSAAALIHLYQISSPTKKNSDIEMTNIREKHATFN